MCCCVKMILRFWWLKQPWKPVVCFRPLGCGFRSCTISVHQSCCNHDWIDCWKVNYWFLRNSMSYTFILFLLGKKSVLHVDGGKKGQKQRSSNSLGGPFIKLQRWKDLKYHLAHNFHLKDKTYICCPSFWLVWSQKAE